MEESGFTDLPDEIVEMVCAFLEAGSLVRFGATCQRARDLAARAPLRCVVTKRRYARGVVQFLLGNGRRVVGVTLLRLGRLSAYGYRWLSDLTELRSLKIKTCRITDTFWGVVPRKVARLEIDRFSDYGGFFWVDDELDDLDAGLFPYLAHVDITLTDNVRTVLLGGECALPPRYDYLRIAACCQAATFDVRGLPAKRVVLALLD